MSKDKSGAGSRNDFVDNRRRYHLVGILEIKKPPNVQKMQDDDANPMRDDDAGAGFVKRDVHFCRGEEEVMTVCEKRM